MEQITMITYKLFRCRRGLYYPLFVETDRSMPLGEWLDAQVGELLGPDPCAQPCSWASCVASWLAQLFSALYRLDREERGGWTAPAAPGYSLDRMRRGGGPAADF